jgi:hypothetical protein
VAKVLALVTRSTFVFLSRLLRHWKRFCSTSDASQVAALSTLIHRTAWKRNSAKFVVAISLAGSHPYAKRDRGKHLLVLPHAPDCCV